MKGSEGAKSKVKGGEKMSTSNENLKIYGQKENQMTKEELQTQVNTNSQEKVPPEIVLISEQLKLLAEWNRNNINSMPEQARKNIETILQILVYFRNY